MNDFKKGGFKKGGFGDRPKFGNKFGGDRGGRSFGGGSKFGGGDRKFGNKFGGPRGGDKPFGRPELFPATCSSCGKACEVPFRPTGEKPVYCRDCFGKQEQAPWRADERRERPQRDFQPDRGPRPFGGNDSGDIAGLKHRILSLEGKLDRVLEILSTGTKPEVKAEVKTETKAPVAVVAKTPMPAHAGEAPKKESPVKASAKPVTSKKAKKGKK